MALKIVELMKRAKEYVELEANIKVINIKFVERFSIFSREDVVLSLTTTDPKEAEWWVVCGSTPMNLYAKSRFPSADEAFSFHTGLMLRLYERDYKESDEPPDQIGYDAFIAHAGEDKETLVRPLAEALIQKDLRIWYDEFELKVGDSLRQSIDKGLVNSRYGIVVISRSFFSKNWPQYELNALVAREIEGHKVILPIWHEVGKEEVLAYSPPLADKVALNTKSMSVAELVEALAKILRES